MKNNTKISIPFLSMLGSLLLLCVFVFLWLQRVYTDEYENVQREADFLFINAIRDFEDELFRNVGDKPIVLQLNDTMGLSKIESTGRAITLIDSILIRNKKLPEGVFNHTDTTHERQIITTVLLADDVKQLDSNFKIKIQTERSTTLPNQFDGALSFYIEMSTDKNACFTDSLNIQALIAKRFAKAIKNASTKLPPNYKILPQIAHSFPHGRLVTQSYTDVFSAESFAAEFSGYQVFILKKMWAEMTFSLLLLLGIMLSYFLIYNNLQKQKRLNQVKNDFISNITHELKTPITTVGVAIEALRSFDGQNNPERLKEYLDISKNELNRLSLLVDKVLKMSLFEQQAPLLSIEEVNAKAIVQTVLNSMKLQFEKHKATVNFETKGEHFLIQADRVHLTNVVYNLLENALKYSKEKPKIDISLHQKTGKTTLKISDKGIGIPPEFLNKVFDKFFRVPTGDTHNVKGHGLGLTYVASVVHQHGGTIKVENRKEGGVCFILEI